MEPRESPIEKLRRLQEAEHRGGATATAEPARPAGGALDKLRRLQARDAESPTGQPPGDGSTTPLPVPPSGPRSMVQPDRLFREGTIEADTLSRVVADNEVSARDADEGRLYQEAHRARVRLRDGDGTRGDVEAADRALSEHRQRREAPGVLDRLERRLDPSGTVDWLHDPDQLRALIREGAGRRDARTFAPDATRRTPPRPPTARDRSGADGRPVEDPDGDLSDALVRLSPPERDDLDREDALRERDAARERAADLSLTDLERAGADLLARTLSTTDDAGEAVTGAYIEGTADALLAELHRAQALPVGEEAWREVQTARAFGTTGGDARVQVFRTEAERDEYVSGLARRIAQANERAEGYRPARVEADLAGADGVGGVLQTLTEGEGVVDNVGTLVGTNLARQPGETVTTTVAGAFGGPLGAAVAGLLSGFSSEERAAIRQAVTEAGVDLTDPDAVQRFAEDVHEWREIQRRARRRGTAIGLVNFVTGGVAGRLGGLAAAPGRTIGQRALLGTVGTAIETAGEFGGEVAAQAAAGDEIDLGEATVEAVAGLGQSAATTASGAAYEGARRALGRPAPATPPVADMQAEQEDVRAEAPTASDVTTAPEVDAPDADAPDVAEAGPVDEQVVPFEATAPDPADEYPVVVRPVRDDTLTITAGQTTDEVTGEGEAGRIVATVRPDAVRVTNAGVSPAEQGKGHGVRMYEAAAEVAAERGVSLESDVEVTPGAARVWEALGRRGYVVERNPDATLQDVDGVEKWVASGPVFRVADPSARADVAPTQAEPAVTIPFGDSESAGNGPPAGSATVDSARPAAVSETGPGVAPPVREEGEAFGDFVGRSREALTAEADRELEAALREEADAVGSSEAVDADAVAVALAERSDNPAVVLRGWRATREAETRALDPTQSVEAAIAEFLPFISSDEAGELGDATGAQRRAYFRAARQLPGTGAGSGTARPTLTEAAEQVSAESGMPVTTADVVSFITQYPSGAGGFRAEVRRPRRAIEGRLREITGEPVSISRVEAHLSALDPAPELDPTPASNPASYGARNTLVREDAYRAALAWLGQTAPFSNPMGDPELWQAGLTVVGFHAEALAREGVAATGQAAEVIARAARDLPRAFEPHLQALFDAVRQEQGADLDAVAAEAAGEQGTTLRAEAPADADPTDGAQDSGQPVGAPPAPRQRAETAPDYAAALTNREIARARDALGLDRLPPAQRRTWEDTLADIVETGFYHEAEGIAHDMVDGGRTTPFSAREHVAVLVRLARAQRTYREAAAQAREAEAAGLDPSEWQTTASASLQTVDLLTRAGRRSGREAGTALAVRALRLEEEAGRFTVSRVLDDARVLKGAALTEGERKELAELAAKVEALTERADAAEAEAAALRHLADKARAEGSLSRAASDGRRGDRTAREARRYALREERAQILDDLGRLGLRANDVTGLTAEAAVLVAKLARNLAAEFGLTLAETVDRVVAEVPGATRAAVIRAIARDGDVNASPDADLERDARAAEKALERARVEEAEAEKAVRAAQEALRPTSRKETAAAVLGSLRTVLASFDMSSVLNQAAPLARRHPLLTATAFWRTLSTFWSRYDAARFDLALRSDPMQAKREAAGLYLAPQGDGATAATFAEREEAFAARRLLERMPWVARSLVGAVVGGAAGTVRLGPGVGTAIGAAYGSVMGPAIRASEDHMVSFLNAVRAGVFDAYARAHPEATIEELSGMAVTVNVLSGRGDLSPDLARAGSAVAFSPRMTVGRFQALGRAARLTTAAGRRAAEALALLAVSNVALLWFVDVAGGDETDVSWDVRRGDFGKLRWGQLRIDPWGGYSQIARLAGRLVLAFTDSVGVTETPGDAREIEPIEEGGRYGKNKLSPWIGATDALLTGKDWKGDPQSRAETLAGLALPIGVQSTHEASEAEGPLSDGGRAAVVFGLNWFGVSADAYLDPTASAAVIAQFERAHVTRYTSAPQGLTDEEKVAFEEDYQRRLADKVRAELPALRRIAEPDDLAARLKALKSEAREEAAGVAEGDPLRQGFALATLRRADGYRPSAPRAEGLTDEQGAQRDSTFSAVMARVIEDDRANLEAEADPDALRDRLQGLRRIAAAELEGDPLADDLGLFVDAGYRPTPSPPRAMPEGEHAAYEADWRRRLAARVAAERDLLSRYGDDTDGLKARLSWHAAQARTAARSAAGY